jgi:hypothetical protein
MILKCENIEDRKVLETECKIGIDQACGGSLIAEYVEIWYTCTK